MSGESTMTNTKYEGFGLYPCSGDMRQECESCHNTRPGRWYVDDYEGGSEWFLCGPCADEVRETRAAEEV